MRLSYKILDNLITLSSSEAKLLLYICKYQNISGKMVGLYYKNVMQEASLCKQSFYNALYSLKSKGILLVEKNHTSDFDVTIVNNDFSSPDSFKNGYINLHKKVFSSEPFISLKSREKFMLFYFMKITHENGSTYRIGSKKFYDKFSEMFSVTCRVIRSYLHNMRHFFSIAIIHGIYYITYRRSVFSQDQKQGIEATEQESFVKAWCRRLKIRIESSQALVDTARLIKQYRFIAGKTEIYGLLSDAIQSALINSQSCILNPKHIHVLLRKQLNL
jgi:hypothetical protein